MINIDTVSNLKNKEEIIKNQIKTLDNFEIKFEFFSDFKNAKPIRDFISVIWEIIWLPEKWLTRLILVTDELNNNAIEYGSKPKDKNTLHLKYEKRGSSHFINIEIIDSGNWPYHKSAEEMYEIQQKRLEKGFKEHSGIRGRWLFQIIHKTVDELYFKNAKHWWLIVWIKKEIIL